MFDGMLQDWTTIAGDGPAPIKQSALAWAELDDYSNVTFWLEVREVDKLDGRHRASHVRDVTTADESCFRPIRRGHARRVDLGGHSRRCVLLTILRSLSRATVRWSAPGPGDRNVEGLLPRVRVADVGPRRSARHPGRHVRLSPDGDERHAGDDGRRDGGHALLHAVSPRAARPSSTDDVGRGFTSGELSLAGPLTASSVYDVFAYYDPATNAVKLEQSFAWSNDTTRVDAVVRKDGVFVKSGNPTRRLVGTVRTDASGNFVDSSSKRWIWNVSNRVDRTLLVTEATGAWTYSGGCVASREQQHRQLGELRGRRGRRPGVRRPLLEAASRPTRSPRVGYVGVGVDSSTAVSAPSPRL